MARKIQQPVSRHPDSGNDSDSDTNIGYPSLAEHRASRRRFLQGGLAVVGAGALATACPGFFPQQLDGAMVEPTYHYCRFPADPEDRAVWLTDGGYARFYAVGLTYYEDVAMFAADDLAALTELIADELSASTYDDLSTASGHAAACNRIRALLNDAYNQNTGDVGDDWFEEVELTFTLLDAPEIMAGVAPDPSYP
jgi:hypothetical protein